MFNKLRWRVVLIIMIVVLASLIIIFSLMYASTKQSLVQQCESRLDSLLAGQLFDHRPGGAGNNSQIPAFTVYINQLNEIVLEQSDFYTLDDELLLSIVSEAFYSGQRSDVLETYSLRYKIEPGAFGTKIAFADISLEANTLNSLVITSVLIGLGVLLAFFVASLFVSKQIVKPLSEAWEKQRSFVADASHELKTPLTVIIANAEMLEYEQEESNEKRIKWAENIKEESKRMRRLVEALLDQAKTDSEITKASHTQLDFSYIVNECVLEFEPVMFEAGKSIRSTIAEGLCVRGDGDHLKQLTAILIDNAMKYSYPSTEIIVELSAEGKRDILLKVTDSGPDIPAENKEKIFDRFYRSDASREANGSYGLGLSIAKGITEQHCGKISVSSGSGKTTFSVLLPSCK